MVTSIVDGRTGYCEHGALRVYSPETRALLDRLRAIAHAHADVDVDVAIDDVVHMDFHTANMLAIDHRITGVIDWEGSTSGDAAFDLVTQALYTPDLRTELLDAARARTDPHALPLYAAHMVLRQVDWSLRHHNAAQVRRYLDEGVALLAATASG
jgi:aminoglycoside phosphotransferase (APT) family kinase protein